MSTIAYDPIKDRFASFIKKSRFLRSIFYSLLDLFFLRSWHVRSVIRSLTKEFSSRPNLKILDAGNGFGQYDRFLIKTFPNASILAVDVKDDYLADCGFYFEKEVAEKRIQFKTVDLLEMKETEPEFDFALCVDVLEHIEDDVKVIRNCANRLKSNGYFLMHSPSHYAEDDADGDESFVGEHARAGYSKQDITEKLILAGLNPVKVHYSYGTLGHAAWVMLIKYPMMWLTLNKFLVVILPFYYLITLIPGLVCMQMDMFTKNEKGTGIYALAQKP
jgi:SAM-dependent methyltransferase